MVKASGSKQVGRTAHRNETTKGQGEKFDAKPFELVLRIYNQKYPMGKRLFQTKFNFSHLIKKGVIKGLMVPQEKTEEGY